MTELVIAQEAALAQAAIEFVRSRHVAAVYRTQENAHRHARADEHLCWLVDAVAHGWHPDEFVSEWDDTPAPEETESVSERARRIQNERRDSWR